MSLRWILSLFLSLVVEGSLSAQPSHRAGSLSYEERALAERLLAHQERCTSKECGDQIYQSIVEIMQLRRTVAAQLMSEPTLQRLKRSCDQHADDLQALMECLRARQNVSFEEGMRLAGYTKAGVTSEGYRQISIGMEMRDLEYILGDYGEEVSYAASRGYSAAVYQWTAGRRMIVVSFTDYKVSGRSQSGLYGR